MYDDNEFQARKEREDRLKNIDYQIEEENKATAARKTKEQERLNRERKKEAKKKEAMKKKAAEEKRASDAKKAERKKQQQEARDAMEQKRNLKHQNAKGSKSSSRASTTSRVEHSIAPASTLGSLDNNKTTVDGKEVNERSLPQDIVNRIKREQTDNIKQNKSTLKNMDEKSSSLGETEQASPLNMANNERVSSRLNSPTGINGRNGLGVGMQNSAPRNIGRAKYSPSGKANDSGGKGTNSDNGANTTGNSNTTGAENNNAEGDNKQQVPNDRETLRNSLAGLGAIRNNNPMSGMNTVGGENPNEDLQNPNTGIFMGGTPNNPVGVSPQNRLRQSNRGSASPNGGSSTSGNDIDSAVGSNTVANMGRTARAAKTTGRTAINAFKTITTAAKMGRLVAMGPFIAGIALVVLLIIMAVGITSFLTNMPGMVRDKIVDIWDTVWQTGKGLIVGQDQPSETTIKNMAEYLEDMGYDLEYNGFVTKLEKDENGKIKDIESKYLASYIAAEQRSYLIANENHNVKAIWNGLFNTDKWDEPWGTGMIVLEGDLVTKIFAGIVRDNSIASFAANLYNKWVRNGGKEEGTKVNDISTASARVIIKRDTKEMYISKTSIADAFNSGGYDLYRYSLKEWTEKYGTPTELFFTLHLATRAPEFAYKFATTYDTKVFIEIKELNDVEIALVYPKTDEDNKVILDDKGKPTMIPISEMPESEIKKRGISADSLNQMKAIDNKKITAFTPYITKIINHWYYQQIIFQGEYNGKKIDVYEIKNLTEGDDGYVRYYAYTRRDNADAEIIEENNKVDEPTPDSFSLWDNLLNAASAYFTCGSSVISGIAQGVSEGALQAAYNQLGDYVVDNISDKIKDVLPDQLAGMLNVDGFLKNGLTDLQLSSLMENGINLSNMGEFVDFNKMFDSFKLSNLDLDVSKMWDELNLQDEIMNMDIAGLGSIDDLKNTIGNIDLSNMNKVFDEKFGKFVDLGDVNFDKLTNQLAKGFSSSIESLQSSILDSCNQMFAGVSEEDFKKISDGLLGSVTGKLSDVASAPIVDQLSGQIEKVVSGKFNDQILSGLQNEFSKQLTGLSYSDLGNLANINGLDFDKLKNLGGQVTDINSALKGAENTMSNLSVKANQLSKDITGMDTKVLNSLSKSVSGFSGNIDSLASNISDTKNLLNTSNLSANTVNDLKNKLKTLEDKTNLLKQASNKLNVSELSTLQGEINKCKQDITNVTNNLQNIDTNVANNLKSQLSKLENKASDVVDNITSLDLKSLELLTYKISGFDSSKLTNLASDLMALDASSNGMRNLISKYGSNITGLNTSELNDIMNLVNGQNITAQQALNGISGYLLRNSENELARSLSQLNSTVNLLTNATKNFDVNTATSLLNAVPGFDASHLTNLAGQLANLKNASMSQLLDQVKEVPKQIVQQVSDSLTKKVTEGVKKQISENLAGKFKNNILNTGNFNSDLKNAMTSGEHQDIDPSLNDHSVEGTYNEYGTGYYIREIRRVDYFQKAEPLRVLYSPEHWKKMFKEDKYVIVSPGTDMSKIDDPAYVEQYGKTIYEATGGNIEKGIYAMLQGIQSSESQYLFRYFKELFNDMSWRLDDDSELSSKTLPNGVKADTIGWIFKTAEVQEPAFVGTPKEVKKETIKVKKSDFENGGIDKILKARQPAEADYYTYLYDSDLKDEKSNYSIRRETIKVEASSYTEAEKLVNKIAESHKRANDVEFWINNAKRKEKLKLTENVQDQIQDIQSDQDAVDLATNIAESNTETTQKVFEFEMEVIFRSEKDHEVTVTYYKYEGKELQTVKKAEYEPYTWAASRVGILNPKSIDPVYGFAPKLEIVSPVNGVVVAKTEAGKNELGQNVSQSVTIELRDTGDSNADGMRIILIGGDYSTLNVGTMLRKVTYEVDDEGNYTGNTQQSFIGYTTDESIKIMVLDKDQTPVEDVSEYIYPPYQQYKPEVGDMK